MEYIPETVREVKSIVTAVHLPTNTRYTYLKGRGGICPFPLESVHGGAEILSGALDEALWDNPDPDNEIVWADGDNPTMSWERSVKPGEIEDHHLARLRMVRLAKISPRESMPASIPAAEPVADEEIHLPAPRSEKNTGDEKSKKKPVRNYPPPRDIMKAIRENPPGEEWASVVVMMYQKSWYGKLNKGWGYAGSSEKKGRFYNLGNVELVKLTRLSKYTISRYLQLMKKSGFLLLHKRGWKDEGCSIWELPCNMKQVHAWKRRHKKASGK